MNTNEWKARIYDIICKDDGDNRASRAFDVVIMALILGSIASIVLEYVGQTLPEKYKRLETNPRENPPGAFISQDEDVDSFQYEEKDKDPSSPSLPF